MSAAIPVHATGAVRAETGSDAVLASLPLSFAPGHTDEGSLVVVAGTIGWPGRVADAESHGAAAVVVVNPELDTTGALPDPGVPVLLDHPWASNPVVTPASAAMTASLPHGDRIECSAVVAVGTDLQHVMLNQLALLRRLLGPVHDVQLLTSSRHGYAAEGVVAGHPVDLSTVCTATAEHADVRLLTADGSVELSIPDPATATPARLTVTGPDGDQTSPTLYESGHRATWRRARSLLADPTSSTVIDDLSGFADDAASTRTAFQHDEGQASTLLAASTLNDEPADRAAEGANP